MRQKQKQEVIFPTGEFVPLDQSVEVKFRGGGSGGACRRSLDSGGSDLWDLQQPGHGPS